MSVYLAWINASLPSRHLCLDLRSTTEHASRCITPSTNIPSTELHLRWSELPPKQTPFAILLSRHETDALDAIQSRHWQVPWILYAEDDTIWTEAARQGRLQEGSSPLDPTLPPRPWLLFQPSAYLSRHIQRIESASTGTWWKCLDIGCGAGRDLAWLLARNHHQSRWRVTGMDNWTGSIQRTHQIVWGMHLESFVDGIVKARVRVDGTWHHTTTRQGTTEFFCNADIFSDANEGADRFQLVMMIRFMSRPLLKDLPLLLVPGGYLLISHFLHVEGHVYETPKEEDRVKPGELAQTYRDYEWNGIKMVILDDVVEHTEDGRPLNSILCQRI
ncbi:hypothetical protein BZG36_00615 [Bifiguratus adelaidae]|uniref:Methyltransferase domain-containing protein n=1 Tax=Bifiguratus adelaidae TaxID=1938954 RepID=A0A261Y782_9FUNG|nr:hypothetical protein BZG36_00615 [Bifiguratus adelaidae]